MRLLGITWGLPDDTHLFSYHPDEYFSLSGALQLLLLGDANPHFFNYPSLYLYLLAGACAIGHGALAMSADVAQLPEVLRGFTLDARLMTVLLALVCVGATYGAANRLGGRKSGLWAAAIVAVAPGHVLYSHFAAVDVPLTCFMMLAAWAGLVLLEDQRPKALLLAGLAAGAAAATKYNGALALMVPLLCLGLWAWRAGLRRTWLQALPRMVAVVAIAALAFALFSPYVLLDWGTAREHIAFERDHMRQGEPAALAAYPSGWGFYFGALSYSVGGPIVLLVLLIGLGLGVKRLWPDALPLFLLAAVWFVMISLTGVRYARYTLPLVPLLAVLVSVARWDRNKPAKPNALLPGIVVLGALVPSLLLSGSMAFEREPRDAALQWIEMHVPHDATVGTGRTIWFDMPPLDYNNGGDALGGMEPWQSLHRPLRDLTAIPVRDPRRLRDERADWFVETDFQTQEWLRARDPEALAFRHALEELCVPEATFRRGLGWWLWGIKGPQPHDYSYPFTTVRVWRLQEPEESPTAPTNPAPGDGSPDPSNPFGR